MTENKGDLISREALKKEIESLVVGGAEGLKNYYENGSKSDENTWIGGIYDAWELIDNAPTVEQKYYERVIAQINPVIEARPQGEWIKIKRNLEDGKHSKFIYRCPFCGYVEGYKANFCGKCGAEMVGGES